MKRWGYEYILVACGAFLGLLIVVIVGFDDPPKSVTNAPEIAAPRSSVPPPKSLSKPPLNPESKPAGPVEALKRIGNQDRLTPGKRPVATSSGRAPKTSALAWQRFAAIHGPILGRPMIAVIIDDMGLDRNRSARAVQLPGPLTMSFLTYARSLRSQAADARRAGHEIMIHVPMEPDDASDYPGPKVIKRDLPEKELKRRLDWVLGRLDNFVGINNHMGSRFTTHAPGMELVLAELKRRGLLFVDSRTSPNSVGEEMARRLSVPFARRDFFLDDDPTRDAVVHQLTALEQAALAKGYAIAIGHPYDSTLGALEKWLPTLASRGFVLVPVSAIVRHRGKAG